MRSTDGPLTNTIQGWSDLASVEPERCWSHSLAAAERLKSTHGAYITVATRPGRQRDGALAGVPFAVKDNIDTAGLPTSGGSSVLKGSTPIVDAGVVRKLLAAGAWINGKANLHELAFGVTSNNRTFGPVRNPFDRMRSAGGSSGGSAVAVSMGAAPFALGTDTGGSMTIPSACCGIVGMRPSPDRYPRDGLIALSHTRDTVGVMATSVADLRCVDAIIAAVKPAQAGRPRRGHPRLALPGEYFEDLDDHVGRQAQAALDALACNGAELKPIRINEIVEEAAGHGFDIVAYEAPRTLQRYLRKLSTPYDQLDVAALAEATASPDVKMILTDVLAHPVSRVRYRSALTARRRLGDRFTELMHSCGVDALVYPTLAVVPPQLSDESTIVHNGREMPVFSTMTRHTEAGSFLANPSISVPVLSGPGLPVGLTFETSSHGDDLLLDIASYAESVLSQQDSNGQGVIHAR
jgi:indoleacetamide hydrolase